MHHTQIAAVCYIFLCYSTLIWKILVIGLVSSLLQQGSGINSLSLQKRYEI